MGPVTTRSLSPGISDCWLFSGPGRGDRLVDWRLWGRGLCHRRGQRRSFSLLWDVGELVVAVVLLLWAATIHLAQFLEFWSPVTLVVVGVGAVC